MPLKLSIREPTGPLDSPLGHELRRIEDHIKKSEGESIEARWEFGHALLPRRKGKKLPNGLLAAMVKEYAISRSEIKYRVQFAEMVKMKDELANALANWPSWREVIKALPKKPAKKTVPANVERIALELKRWHRYLGKIKSRARELTDAELNELTRIHEQIEAIFDARSQKEQKAQ